MFQYPALQIGTVHRKAFEAALKLPDPVAAMTSLDDVIWFRAVPSDDLKALIRLGFCTPNVALAACWHTEARRWK